MPATRKTRYTLRAVQPSNDFGELYLFGVFDDRDRAAEIGQQWERALNKGLPEHDSQTWVIVPVPLLPATAAARDRKLGD